MKTFGVAIEILGKCGYTMKCGIGDFASYLGIMEQGKDTATFRKFGSGKDSLAESGVQELIVVDATTAVRAGHWAPGQCRKSEPNPVG